MGTLKVEKMRYVFDICIPLSFHRTNLCSMFVPFALHLRSVEGAFGGRPIGSVFWISYIINIYGYSLYIPYIFHTYFLNVFHICSLVCFLLYGIKRRQALRFLEDFALIWSFWDMMDMSMFRLLIQFRTFRIQNYMCDVIFKWFCMVLRGGAQKTLFFGFH